MDDQTKSEAHASALAIKLDLLSGADITELDRLTALAEDVCEAEFAAFTIHDASLAYQVSTSFGVRDVLPNTDCICSVAMRPGAAVVIDDARASPATARYRHVAHDLHLRSFAGAPVELEAGEVVGVLAIGHAQPARFGAVEIRRLERIGALVRAFLAARRQALLAQRSAEQNEIAQKLAESGLSERNAQLGEALAAAERANRARSDFLGVVSHELRTPMNAILGCAALLRRSQLNGGQERTLGVLQDAGRQMQALLNDLIDMSGLDADKIRIEPEPVSLSRMLEDAAAIWSADIRARGLGLCVMIEPSLVPFREVDSGRLLQIVGNLISNAIKFTHTGDITLRGWASGVGRTSDIVTIEIEDTGIGIAPDAIERIFSPFEQADRSPRRAHGGLGLGLHVARRLAAAMGGGVAVVSTPGEGSRFTVTIRAPLTGDGVRLHPDIGAGVEGRVRRILCVDDNPRNLFVIAALVEAAGYEVRQCDQGQSALDLLAVEPFDGILLDMVMPGMDGLDVLSALRSRPGPNRETPVIACTANIMPDQVRTYIDAGSCAVVAKPIDVKALLEALAAAT